MTNNLAPIVVFAYDRPDHLRQTLDALAKNDLANESVLYIYCDGAKEWGGELSSSMPVWQYKEYLYGTSSDNDAYLKRIEQTRYVAQTQKGFKEVRVVEREHNIGLADNIVGAVTEIVNQYGRIIAFEDDVVTSKGVLKYFNDALELYKDDDKVMHISSYIYPHKQKFPTTFFHPSPYPAGGWATWARAWTYFTTNTQELVDYWSQDWKTFNVLGLDHLQKQLLLNLDGRLRTWYVKWYASMRRVGGLCLYPGVSMSNNIGFDGSGETSGTADTSRYFNKIVNDYTIVERIPIKINKRAFRWMRVRSSGHWYSKRHRQIWLNKIMSLFKILRR